MVCPHCELAHSPGTTSCSRCGRTLSSPDQEATAVFDSADTAAAATKPPAAPTVASGVITPPPSDTPQARTAVHFSGAFSMTLQPGTDFGPRYRIEALLGEGGMGTVYKATDKELGRTVALKLVRPEYASIPSAMARFRQELLLASKISHKNILRIHDLGDAGGMKFITMAYVDGEDLGKLMEAGRLPLERVLNFARQLCSALDAAHSEEVVHRDLKPNNILVDKADSIYVMDFGLAKSFETDATMMTRTGQILGTPRYMAPEQVEAKPTDHRADIYSFGLILFELVTGEVPFRANSTLQLMYQRVNEAPKDPRTVCPDVPEYLANIILKCLDRDPEKRYQSAREILADIEAQTAPIVSDAKAAQTVTIQLPRPRRRSWFAAAGVLAAVIALVLTLPVTRHWLSGSGGGPKAEGHSGVQHYLAFLPLRIIGEPENAQYLADGVVDSVSAKLGSLGNVYVASSTAVSSALSKKNQDPAKVARSLGVTLLVQGAIQTSGDKLAVTISLDDVDKNGRNLFHREFSGVRQDLLTLEDSIFDTVVKALEIRRTTDEMARTSLRPTENSGAYDIYLRGQNLSRTAQNVKGLQEAVSLLEQAVTQDHRFALAYAGMADAYLKLWSKTKDSAWTQKAAGAAQEAQVLNDSLPEVHFVLGSVDTVTGRTAEAIGELQRALQLAPNSDEALRRLGRAHMAAGQQAEAIAACLKATTVNPYASINYLALGQAYFKFGENEKALRAYQRVTELDPDLASGYANMGSAYYRLGRLNDAVPMFQKAITLQPSASYYSNLGTMYFFLGQYNGAVEMFEKAGGMQPNDVLFQRNLGDAYRWSGQREKAAKAYDKAIELAYRIYQVNPQNAENLGYLAICYAKKGNDAQAMKFLQSARQIDPKDNALMYKEATIQALAGRTTQALASLGQALQSGYSLQEVKSDPELKPLREHPEFARLLAQAEAAAH